MGSASGMLDSWKFFKEGLQQYNTQKAVNDAVKQVQDLNQQQLDEKDRLAANQMIGNELAMRMTAAGAQPGQVQQATSGLLQSANVMSQNVATAERQDDQNTFTAGENQLNRESNERIAGMRNAGKNSTAIGSFIKGAQGDFDKLAKGPREMLSFANVALKALDPKNPILDAAVVNFMARSSGEKGPLTEADKAPFGGSQAYDAKAKQFIEKAKTGKLDDSNRAFLRQAVSVFGAQGKASLRDFRNQIASRSEKVAQTRGFDLTKEEIADFLMTEELEQQEQKPSKAQALKAWIANNPKSPRLQEAQQALQKLEQQGKP